MLQQLSLTRQSCRHGRLIPSRRRRADAARCRGGHSHAPWTRHVTTCSALFRMPLALLLVISGMLNQSHSRTHLLRVRNSSESKKIYISHKPPTGISLHYDEPGAASATYSRRLPNPPLNFCEKPRCSSFGSRHLGPFPVRGGRVALALRPRPGPHRTRLELGQLRRCYFPAPCAWRCIPFSAMQAVSPSSHRVRWPLSNVERRCVKFQHQSNAVETQLHVRSDWPAGQNRIRAVLVKPMTRALWIQHILCHGTLHNTKFFCSAAPCPLFRDFAISSSAPGQAWHQHSPRHSASH